MKIKSNALRFFASFALCQGAGLIGGLFTSSSLDDWYYFLEKPMLNPPSWVFGPVWTILYILMAISLYIVWSKPSGIERTKALKLFSVQLVLNALWSILFFGLESAGAAFINVIFMWLAILGTIFSFRKISKTSAYLLIPYIVWVSFAAYLNYAIWILNRPL